MTIAGAPYFCNHGPDGVPNSVTAATWFATSGGMGWGTIAAGTPGGTAAEVTKPATAAPWEYPPSTSLVLGQFAAIDSMCVPASRMPSMTPRGKSGLLKSVLAW